MCRPRRQAQAEILGRERGHIRVLFPMIHQDETVVIPTPLRTAVVAELDCLRASGSLALVEFVAFVRRGGCKPTHKHQKQLL